MVVILKRWRRVALLDKRHRTVMILALNSRGPLREVGYRVMLLAVQAAQWQQALEALLLMFRCPIVITLMWIK